MPTLAEIKTLADQGQAQAQFRLGVIYAEGVGTPQDFKAAFRLFPAGTSDWVNRSSPSVFPIPQFRAMNQS